jgi:adenylate cyclase
MSGAPVAATTRRHRGQSGDGGSPVTGDRARDHAQALDHVRSLLRAQGTSDEEIDEAEAGDVLDLLVADRLFVPAGQRYTEGEVAAKTAMEVGLLRRFWRALGFPDVAPDDPKFTDLDVDALLTLRALMELGAADVESSLQLARVIGASMARIADAEMSPAARGITLAAAPGDSVAAADRFAQLADRTIPAMGHLLEFVWRRHVQAAIRRIMLLRRSGDAVRPVLAVGFADMVGFTTLSQQLSEEELAAVVGRFEEVARDTVTAGAGRVVKMIGDEAMFVADTVLDAARIGLALAEAYADDELLSDVRVALAVGPVLLQDGDYYGPVVNLASRVVNMAAPGSVLVTDEFHQELGESSEFAFRPLRPRQIKDVGRIQLWSLFRPGTEPVALDRRMGRRWERLADLLHDLDDLRERGERLVTGARGTGAEEQDRPASAGASRQPAGRDSGLVIDPASIDSAPSGGEVHRGDTEGP